jgi:microsomal dipeptidase-like Zn-dependent dipeptidase
LADLTALGADVICECNRLGILVDLAHGSVDIARAALKITTKPVIISHTGLDTRLGQNPEHGSDAAAAGSARSSPREVAGAGGVVCAWTHLADTPAEYVPKIWALVDVMGIDHVGIGTDTKLTTANRGARGSERGPQKSLTFSRTLRPVAGPRLASTADADRLAWSPDPVAGGLASARIRPGKARRSASTTASSMRC